MSRRPTDAEWAGLVGLFPALVRDDTWITGEPTRVYNCIAFSMGFYDRWIDPERPIAAFQLQYARRGFPVVAPAAANVDGWGTSPAWMTHASRFSVDPGFAAQGLWESKLGVSFRITHSRYNLVGVNYGMVLTNFLGIMVESTDGESPRLPAMEPELTEEEYALLLERATAQVLAGPDGRALIDEFAAQRQRFLEAVRLSALSDTAAFAGLPEFADLVGLGPRIAPLIVAQLAEEPGFLLLGVLEALVPELVAIDYDPLSGLQSLARLVARAWLAG